MGLRIPIVQCWQIGYFLGLVKLQHGCRNPSFGETEAAIREMTERILWVLRQDGFVQCFGRLQVIQIQVDLNQFSTLAESFPWSLSSRRSSLLALAQSLVWM